MSPFHAALSPASQTVSHTGGSPRRAGNLAKGWKYHQVDASRLTEHKRYAGKGRPTPKTPLKAVSGKSTRTSGLRTRPYDARSKARPALCSARISAPAS